jgi:hypothetical protein
MNKNKIMYFFSIVMYNYLYDKDKCILKNCALEQKKAIEKMEQLSK